jgi:hypothetical protein
MGGIWGGSGPLYIYIYIFIDNSIFFSAGETILAGDSKVLPASEARSRSG